MCECILLLQFDHRDFACCWDAPVRATQVCTANTNRLLKLLYLSPISCRLKGQGGVDKNDVRVIAGPLMDMLTKR